MSNRLIIAFVGLLVLGVNWAQDVAEVPDKRAGCERNNVVRGKLDLVWTGAANTQEESVADLPPTSPERAAIDDYATILRDAVDVLEESTGSLAEAPGSSKTRCDDAFPMPWPLNWLGY